LPRLEEIVDTDRLQRAPAGAVPFAPNEWLEARLCEFLERPAWFARSYSTAVQRSVAAYAAAKVRAQSEATS